MVRLSKRFKKIIKRKSLQQRKSKRGGESEKELETLLGKLEIMREEAGDFNDLSSLNTSQLITKARELRNASNGIVSLERAAEFGKKQILYSLNQISKYTDDLIKELLIYNTGSISTFLLENRLIEHIDQNLFQNYLPSSMWRLFGGVNNFMNWLISQIGRKSFLESDKPNITKDILLYILKNLNSKYPTINMGDSYIKDLVLKDLLKKLYYLNEPNSVTQLQPMIQNRMNHPTWSDISRVAKQGVIKLGKAVFYLAAFLTSAWIVLMAVICWKIQDLPNRCISLNDL
jgi:hypothetical protein